MQTLDQNTIVVKSAITELADSKKKSILHILHVDDDPSLLEISKLLLTDIESSFEIEQACNVDEALKKLSTRLYDVVVSDYEMPQKDGLQFLKELRESKNKIPFILFTGKGREEVAIQALNLGAQAYHNKQGNPETVYGELAHSIKQITEHYKIEAAMQSQEKRFTKLASQTPGMLYQFLKRPNGTYCVPFTTEAIRDFFGCSPQDVQMDFSTIAKVIIPEDLKKVIDSIEYSASNLTIWQCEYRVQLPNQNVRWMWGQSVPERLDDGSVFWSGFNTDITEHKQAEDALRKSESKYRLLAENSNDVIWTMDLEGHFSYVSPSVFQLSGYTVDEVQKQSILEVLTPDSANKALGALNRFKETGEVTSGFLEFEAFCKDGTTIWIETNFSVQMDQNGNPVSILGVSRNIAERKKIEAALETSEQQFRQLFLGMPSGAAVYEAVEDGKDFVFIDFNPAAEKIEGINKENVIGKQVTKIFPGVESFGLLEVFQRVWHTGQSEYYPTSIYKDEKDPGTWRENWIFKLSNERIGAIYNDVTERKRTEEQQKKLERKINEYSKHLKYMVDLRTVQLKDANERLLKSERLAAIGELAGMVGHDLRNPLAAIKNAAYFLKKKGSTISETQYKEMLEIINKSIDHSDKIINDLLEYSRELHLELVDSTLPKLLDAAMKMTCVPDRIQIINNVCDETVIKVDADKIMRIFVNLIKNAIDAMPENGTFTITSCKTKDYIELSFSDTGTGISEETLKKIFTPLFTTKAQGMGFGLAICKRIIEAHKGTITVKTELKKGTTFKISLPIKPKTPTIGE